MGVEDPLHLQFQANKYGPYSDRLPHLLDGLDGSYLRCDKRLNDSGPSDTIWFDHQKRAFLDLYFKQEENRSLREIVDRTEALIDGFQSPFGMEPLATVDWLLERENCDPTVVSIREGLARWPAGPESAQRKLKLFDDRVIGLALQQLAH